MNIKYPRGSEWIKCDLHIHTPYSIKQHYGDPNDENTWEKFISDLENLPEAFKIIGINDYWFIDGYKKVLDYKKKGRISNIDLILPVIELRVDKFGSLSADDPWKRVNYHVIFSDTLSIEVIQSQFLSTLTSKYKLTPEIMGQQITWNGVITKDSLEDLGQKIKLSSTVTIATSDLETGFNAINVPYEDVKKILENNSFLTGKYLTAIGKTEWDILRWDGSIAEKKSIINSADFVFTSSANPMAYKKAKDKLIEQGVNDLLLDCSDAHSLREKQDEKDRIGNCFTWVKVNPTFQGLAYLKYEKDDRLFVGDQPEILTRVNANRTKYIRSVSVNQIKDYNENQGVWFNNISVPLSRELTVVIGNKGKGKSAITDIIGLCGNSHNNSYFSFLSPKKFNKKNLASNFNATVDWESDGFNSEKNLNDNIDINNQELVKYLPQNYFENLCNDIDNNENFKKELNEVVFTHIDISDRLGKSNFEDFIGIKQKSAQDQIKELQVQLSQINIEIVKLLKKNTTEYKLQIENKINIKRVELSSHDSLKPVDPFPKTEQESEDQVSISIQERRLEVIGMDIEVIQGQINSKELDLEQTNLKIETLSRIEKNLNFEGERIQTIRNDYKNQLNDFNIEIESVFSEVLINTKIIKSKLDQLFDIQTILQLETGKIPYNSEIHKTLISDPKALLKNKLLSIEFEQKSLLESLGMKAKQTAEFRISLRDWNDKRKEIMGTSENPASDSLSALQNELVFISDNLNQNLLNLRKIRVNKTKQIYQVKKEITDIYNKLKKNIDTVLAENSHSIEGYGISLEASLLIKDLQEKFLFRIDRSKAGSFYGIEESERLIKNIINNVNTDSEESIVTFITDICERLEMRDGEKMNPFNQLKSAESLEDLYNYIFGLDFLFPKYELLFMDKTIEQLSPGERGAALIVFYLLLDKNDIPLIIDQPEDNLDNQSVYKILVPFIKGAKKRRQLIIVTHNPNLAVVSDAEQVIRVDIDKSANNTFSFICGAIESPEINKGIVDVLEGTKPAFDKRKLKYLN